MDHGEDAEVEQLFARIRAEQRGRLDILVNNAYAGVATIFSSVGETIYYVQMYRSIVDRLWLVGKKFWETDPAHSWDTINGVGLRGHYLCTVLAARMMVPRRSGLIVTVSSIGGLKWGRGRWSPSPLLATVQGLGPGGDVRPHVQRLLRRGQGGLRPHGLGLRLRAPPGRGDHDLAVARPSQH